MTTPTQELCERLSGAVLLAGPNRAFLEELKAFIESQAGRIEGLEAKCALLAASLDQAEREKDEAEKHAVELAMMGRGDNGNA